MKILFLHTDIHRFDPEDYGFKGLISRTDMQFGISYISSYLKKHGHSSSLLFVNHRSWENDVSSRVINYKPDILCFSGVSTQFKYLLKISQFLKKNFPKIYQVFGGVHATLADLKLADLPFDAICKGEGEAPMLELAEKLEKKESPREIMNLTIKENGRILSSPTRPFIQNLDELPFPDREIWDKYVDPNAFYKHAILLSRGCPFECTYCSNKALARTAKGQYVRFRSPENVIGELDFVTKKYPQVRDIFFESETITTNLPWLQEFCTKLALYNASLPYSLKFGTNIRIARRTNYSHIFEILKKASFKYIAVGIESGSERVRKDVLRRDYSNEDIISVFRKAREHGLKIHAYNIVGLPGETPADFKETIKINRICEPEDPHLSVFFPYPGTDLFKICVEKGYLRKDLDLVEEREDAALDMKFLPKKKIEKYYAQFEWNIYRGKKNTFLLLYKYLYRMYIIKSKRALRFYLFLRGILAKIPGKGRNIKHTRYSTDIPDTTYTLW